MSDFEDFEEWFKSTKWFTGDNCSPKYQTYRSMWQAWQASTQRQGYKLAPLEPSEKMIKHAEDARYMDSEEVCVTTYKAMINAV